jgi:hypothetical protein
MRVPLLIEGILGHSGTASEFFEVVPNSAVGNDLATSHIWTPARQGIWYFLGRVSVAMID